MMQRYWYIGIILVSSFSRMCFAQSNDKIDQQDYSHYDPVTSFQLVLGPENQLLLDAKRIDSIYDLIINFMTDTKNSGRSIYFLQIVFSGYVRTFEDWLREERKLGVKCQKNIQWIAILERKVEKEIGKRKIAAKILLAHAYLRGTPTQFDKAFPLINGILMDKSLEQFHTLGVFSIAFFPEEWISPETVDKLMERQAEKDPQYHYILESGKINSKFVNVFMGKHEDLGQADKDKIDLVMKQDIVNIVHDDTPYIMWDVSVVLGGFLSEAKLLKIINLLNDKNDPPYLGRSCRTRGYMKLAELRMCKGDLVKAEEYAHKGFECNNGREPNNYTALTNLMEAIQKAKRDKMKKEDKK